MPHLDVIVGAARKEQPCERCGEPIRVGDKVAHYPVTKTTAHLGCHVQRRRRS